MEWDLVRMGRWFGDGQESLVVVVKGKRCSLNIRSSRRGSRLVKVKIAMVDRVE